MMNNDMSPEQARQFAAWQKANAAIARRSEQHARMIAAAAAVLTMTVLVVALWGR